MELYWEVGEMFGGKNRYWDGFGDFLDFFLRFRFKMIRRIGCRELVGFGYFFMRIFIYR